MKMKRMLLCFYEINCYLLLLSILRIVYNKPNGKYNRKLLNKKKKKKQKLNVLFLPLIHNFKANIKFKLGKYLIRYIGKKCDEKSRRTETGGK